MDATVLLLAFGLAAAGPERDATTRARELYNLHQYDAAIKVAEEARRRPEAVDAATLILGRAYVERFRTTRDASDLTAARTVLRQVDPGKLSPRDSVDLVIGLGETLYLDGQFGAAAELFDLALAVPGRVEGVARDGLLDWWADSLDRQAATAASRESAYARMLKRMEDEAQRDTRSLAASYWLVVAARGVGDQDRAWYAAIAAWVRAHDMNPRGVTLRTDLDRYVNDVIIPERARRSTPGDESARANTLRAEWESLKQQWTPP